TRGGDTPRAAARARYPAGLAAWRGSAPLMSTRDGSVLGAVKIVDNGPDWLRYTIGLLPDGYTAAEMPKWESDAQDAVDRLFSVAPFSDLELTCAFNVYRVDVISDEAGADDPKCGGPGLGSKAATYFDATF